jgi:Bacterial PH domain
VKYKTIPYKYMSAFEFETAGHLDRDAEVYCYTTTSEIWSFGPPRSVGLLRTKKSVLVKSCDIYKIGKHLMEHVLIGEQSPDVLEPEIELIFD